jgi:uncharacterized protein (DUF2147 family)
MKKTLGHILAFCCAIFGFLPLFAFAQAQPIGSWKTYDLQHNPRSIVKLTLQNGTLIGVIQKNLSPGKICTACRGKLRNKPLVGLPIIWGLKPEGDKWVNGHVLDVDSGKVYRCQLKVSADNRVLYFTAYVGMPLLGATLKWIKMN